MTDLYLQILFENKNGNKIMHNIFKRLVMSSVMTEVGATA